MTQILIMGERQPEDTGCHSSGPTQEHYRTGHSAINQAVRLASSTNLQTAIITAIKALLLSLVEERY